MSNTTPNEKPLRAGQWSDEEKTKLLFQIIFQLPKIDWKQITPPAGRDLKSCQNMIDGEKRRLGISRAEHGKGNGKTAEETPVKEGLTTPKTEGNENDSPFNLGEGNGVGTPTPAKKKAAPRKRKAATSAATNGDGDGNDNPVDKTDEGADETPKKKRGPKPKVKKEPTENEGDGATNAGDNANDAGEEKPKKKRGPKPKVKKEAAQADFEGNKLPEIESSKIKEFGGGMGEPLFGPHTPAGNGAAGENEA